jgi:hypothetical protein
MNNHITLNLFQGFQTAKKTHIPQLWDSTIF